MFGQRKEPKDIVTREEVIATRNVYELTNDASRHHIDFRQYTTEFWDVAGEQIASEIEKEAYACSFDLLRALGQGQSVISIVELQNHAIDRIKRIRKSGNYNEQTASCEPVIELNRMLTTFYNEYQGYGRLLPCTYGESFVLLSDGVPIQVFAQFFEDHWPLRWERHKICIYKQTFDTLSRMTGSQLLEMTDSNDIMLIGQFSEERSLLMDYNPEEMSFDRIASAAKEVMTKHHKTLEVVEC